MSAPSCLVEGKRLFQVGDYSMAIDKFEKAIEESANKVDSYLGLGFALHAIGKSSQAVCAFREGLAINPNVAELHFGHGLALMESGDPYRAIREFKRTLELSPQHPLCRQMLRKALQLHTKELLASGNVNWAEQMIQDQLELDEHCCDALAQMIELKNMMSEYGEARRLFRQLNETKPDHPAIPDLAKLLGLIKHRERGWLY